MRSESPLRETRRSFLCEKIGSIARQNGDGKVHLVFYSLTRWLALRPELKVLDPVIGAVAVDVVHVFIAIQGLPRASDITKRCSMTFPELFAMGLSGT